MNLFLYDPYSKDSTGTERRSWDEMLSGHFMDIIWRRHRLVTVSTKEIASDGLVVFHMTRVDEKDWPLIFEFSRENALSLILVTGGCYTPEILPEFAYRRKAPVKDSGVDKSFKECFKRFWEDYVDDGQPTFELLEPDNEYENVFGVLSFLCQGYLLTHFDPCKKIADKDFAVCNKSLARMGCSDKTDFPSLISILKPELFDLDKRTSLREIAASSEYWKVFDGQYKEVIESIRSDQKSNEFSDVVKLLDIVMQKNNTLTIQLKMVTDAFMAITKTLPLNTTTIENQNNNDDNSQRLVFICSEDIPWAETVNRCLSLLTDLVCFIVPSTNPDKIASELHSNSLDYSGISDAICIVYFNTDSSDVISQCINTSVFLRNSHFQWKNCQSRWIGGFIGIMKNKSYINEINNSYMLGNEIDNGIRFGNLGINKCIGSPLSILQLLHSLSNIATLGRHEWDNICSTYPAKKLYNYAIEKRDMIESNTFCKTDVPQVYEVIKSGWSQINWRATLAHEWKNHVVHLNEIPLPTTNNEMRQFLCKAIHVLEQLFAFQGLSEEGKHGKYFHIN